MERYEELYENFWKSIIENEDGTTNIDQVKRELADYSDLMKNVTTVYSELAGLSKPNTDPIYIIERVNETMIDKEFAFDDINTMLNDGTLDEEALKSYFDIE